VARRKEPYNVFYIPLIVIGVAFAITAFAYFAMALRARGAIYAESVPLMQWLSRRGGLVLAIELGLLAVATFGAIASDHFSMRRHDATDRDRRSEL